MTSTVPAEQLGASLDGVRNQAILYVVLVFLALLGGQLVVQRRRGRGPVATPAAPKLAIVTGTVEAGGATLPVPVGSAQSVGLQDAEACEATAAPPEPPRKLPVVALHASLRGLNQLLDGAGPEEAAEALNDYFETAALVARAWGGLFEIYAGGSFGATWEFTEGGDALKQAVGCALKLPPGDGAVNESRKLRRQKAGAAGHGAARGPGAARADRRAAELKLCTTGEAVACARALDRLALTEGKDFVASQEALKIAHGVFTGRALGEARLTADTGLTAYYSIVDYKEDPGLPEGKLK